MCNTFELNTFCEVLFHLSMSSTIKMSKGSKRVVNKVSLAILCVMFYLMAVGFMKSILFLPEVEYDIHDSKRIKVIPRLSTKNDLHRRKISVTKTEGSKNKVMDKIGKPLMWLVKKTAESEKKKVIEIDGVILPESNFPASIRYEDDNFEEIIHPGNLKTKISVPKFWSDPLNGGNLMSAKLAARIGTYVNGNTDTNPEAKGPVDERTVFIMIASYRDWQCRYTVESIFSRAKFPNRVRVGIVDQIDEGDPSCGSSIVSCESDPNQQLCKYNGQIDVIEIDSVLAIGPVFARHLGYRLYRGEYYAMQVDAHVTFAQDWDVNIISQHEATKNDMAVLSTYLSADYEGSLDKDGYSTVPSRPIMCNTDYEDGQGKHLRHGSQPEGYPEIKGTPQLQPYWAAGFSFARGHFVVNVPYDLYAPMIFQGEEMSIGIRGFTYGYDFYAPERSICFHSYASAGVNAQKRKNVKTFWDHAVLYRGSGIKAMQRLLGVIGMNPEINPSEWRHDEQARYGIGNVRKNTKFFQTFGIDVVHKVVVPKLCRFVTSGKMHHMFTAHLRADSMGIDYSKIDFIFGKSKF